jgi:hypothetical protein
MKVVQGRLGRLVGLALAIALCLPTFSAVPAAAAGAPFVGGPITDDLPQYVPNDHTALATRIEATGLTPNHAYEVKIRLSPNPAPASSDNRGFTWNPAQGTWSRNRGPAWAQGNFPIVTTNASGEITEDESGWIFFKFGNEMDSGTYYVIVTLNGGGEGDAQNALDPPTVTVLDMKTEGTKVHPGVSGATTTSQAARRVVVASGESTSNASHVWTISRTETNTVDDDSNGTVDDESWGLAGVIGDYNLAGPTGHAIDVWLQQNRRVSDFMLANPDEDIALGATDTTAPAAPTNLAAVAGDKKVSLTWDAATDNVGVTKYQVHRWAVSSSLEFTPAKTLVGTTTETSFEDTTTVVGGIDYKYEVRAVDAATNVSARSDSASVTSMATAPSISAGVAPSSPNGTGGWYKGSVPKVSLTTTGTAFYSWDNPAAAFTEYTGPVNALSGSHTLYYYSEDEYGNQGPIQNIAVKYDAVAPVSSMSAPSVSTYASATRSFKISWSAVDAASGAANYDVQYKRNAGGTYQTWRSMTTAKQGTFTGAAGVTYYFRVRARDAAGNVGPWSSVKSSMVPYDNSRLTFAGTWRTASSSAFYLGSSRYTTSGSAVSRIGIVGGSAAYLVTTKGPNRSRVRVYLDGKYIRTVSLYSAGYKHRQAVYLCNLPKSGGHVLTIRNYPTSTRKRLDVDGIAIKR